MLKSHVEIINYPIGQVQSKSFYLGEMLHCEDGPASISYATDGSIEHEMFYINDELHRVDGPASIRTDDDGCITHGWCVNGMLHRDGGPALIEFDKLGNVSKETWFNEGSFIEAPVAKARRFPSYDSNR